VERGKKLPLMTPSGPVPGPAVGVPPGNDTYTGCFRHTTDEKGRITIPAEWRSGHEGANNRFLAAPSPDGCVMVLPPPEIEKINAKFSAIKLHDAGGQALAASFYSKMQRLSFDAQGRITVNAGLLVHAGIEIGAEVVLAGSGSMFKLYSPGRWAQVEQKTAGENFGDLMRRLDL
jgi:MraZ protein